MATRAGFVPDQQAADAVSTHVVGERPAGEDLLEELIDALVYEGYAHHLYTPGAVKDATSSPLGILYPPAYTEGRPATFDHLRMDVGLVSRADATLQAEVRFLQAGTPGSDERGVRRRVQLPPTPLAELRGDCIRAEFAFDGLTGAVAVRAETVHEWLTRVSVHVQNTTPLVSPETARRGRALQSSLLSTHPIARAPGGRFLSDVSHPEWASVNTFPVLANPEDDTVLGAVIVLPDHPQIPGASLV